MHAYTNLNKMCSYSQFQVEFVGEDGVDTGGLKREFFLSFSRNSTENTCT